MVEPRWLDFCFNFYGTTTTTLTLTRPLNDVAVTSTFVVNASQDLKPRTPPAAIGNANAGSATITGLGSAESGLVNEAEEGKSAEPTEKAKEEVQPVPISSWYSPWGWYSSANASGPHQLESESLEAEDLQVDVPHSVNRPEPTSSASSLEGDTPSAPAQPTNPITTSMEANWGDWASFFSSRTFMVKTVGYGGGCRIQDVKRDEDGMEVMDLDDDDDAALSKDSGREDGVRGKAMSSSSILIANARPMMLKSSKVKTVKLHESNCRSQMTPETRENSLFLSLLLNPHRRVSIPPSSSPSPRDGNL
jgi:hypothetical protein